MKEREESLSPKKAPETRESSVELLKLIAIFFIVICHSFDGLGCLHPEIIGSDGIFNDLTIATMNPILIVEVILSAFGQLGNLIFLICSSWFLSRSSKVKPQKILKMIAGDSVIYGSSTNGVAVSEFLSKTTGCLCVKDAISGTKLQCIDNDPLSFLSRVVSGTTLKPDKEIDGFFIQISVNDVSSLNYKNMGDLSSQTNINLNSFDVSTTLGSLEYIVNYIENTWDCPIFLCTQSFYENSGSRQAGFFNPDWYTVLLDKVYSLIDKYDTFSNFDVEIINLFYDDAFNNAVSDLYFDWAMDDSIHPKLAGYRNWWTPYFISYLEAFFANAAD